MFGDDQARRRAPGGGARQFSDLRASELFCPRCKRAMPVREKLLLLLLDGEIHEFLCMRCGTSLGTRRIASTAQGQIITRF